MISIIICVGSYTRGTDQNGINLFEFDDAAGKLTWKCGGGAGRSPSSMAVGEKYLYATDDRPDKGRLDAYAWDKNDKIDYIGGCDIPGSILCHVALWPGGKFLSCSNYMSGSLAVCGLDNDKIPAFISAYEQHSGVGYDSKGRQDGPYIHFSAVTPDKRRLLVNDLGLDWVGCYRIDGQTGTLTPDAAENQVYTPKGEGPRHLAFSPNGNFWYLLTEMGCHIFAYSYDAGTGKSSLICSLPMLPDGFDGFNIASDIHFSPDGRYLYAFNRGRNDIVCYEADSKTGIIVFVGRYASHTDMARSFTVTENHIILAGQESDNVVALRRDSLRGTVHGIADEVKLAKAAFVCAL